MRLLLNSPRDDLQIVLVFWGSSHGSPIHDHDGTIGAVSALTGQTKEIKYQISGRDELGVTLAEKSNLLIVPTKITKILPEDDMQVHLMGRYAGAPDDERNTAVDGDGAHLSHGHPPLPSVRTEEWRSLSSGRDRVVV